MDYVAEAKRLRPLIVQASATLEDRSASAAPQLFAGLKEDGSLIHAGTRINWQGRILRAAVDVWDRAEASPDVAPTLWEEIGYLEGERVIPEVITVGTAFSKGKRGGWKEQLYESLMDGNVHTPEANPAGWKAV